MRSAVSTLATKQRNGVLGLMAAFYRWLGSKKTDLCQLNTALIQEFLASTQVKREQRERYQLIITSVYEHWHNADQAVSSNVCTSDINDPFRQIWRNVEGNNKRSFLTSGRSGCVRAYA